MSGFQRQQRNSIREEVASPAQKMPSSFQVLKALAATTTQVAATLNGALQPGEDLDMSLVGQQLEEDIQQQIEEENHVDGEYSYSDEEGGDEAAQKPTINGFNTSKKDGEPYTITGNYIFQGTLKQFATDPAKFTQQSLNCPELSKFGHKQIITSTKVTFGQNSTPFPINFKLDNAPVSNLHLDTNPNSYKETTFKIIPNLHTPMKINSVIYSDGQKEQEIEHTQWEFANTSPTEIENSIGFPDFGANDPSVKNNAEMLESIEQQKKRIEDNGFCFVIKKSPLGLFIQSEIEGHSVPSALCNQDHFPDHFLLTKNEVGEHMKNLRTSIETSPFGNIHGMMGRISRGDGQAWDYMPEGIPEEEAAHLLNNRQTVHLTIEHTVQAFIWG